MKKLFLMGLVALGLASCVSDKEVTPQTQDQKYAAAFENLVGGKINANVNWGFNDQQVVTFDSEGKFAGMRGVYPNANQYGMYINVPTEMTQAQKDKVTKYFTEVNNPAGISVNWSDFFVHNVSSTDKGPSMNQLICGANDLSNSDHVLNFNSGSSTSSKNVGIEPLDANNARQVNYYDGIQLCQNSRYRLSKQLVNFLATNRQRLGTTSCPQSDNSVIIYKCHVEYGIIEVPVALTVSIANLRKVAGNQVLNHDALSILIETWRYADNPVIEVIVTVFNTTINTMLIVETYEPHTSNRRTVGNCSINHLTSYHNKIV